jgi:hypothetical protein
MKALNALLTVATMAIVAGCGGGSGSTSSAQPTPTPPVTTPTTVTNPLTGTAAPGSPTKTLYGSAYAGASVTAYSVLADGTSGPALAGPVTSTIDGFTLNFTDAPTGWVRLVATGGTKIRAADNTVQPGGTMQLVTPFVTTSQNNFKISPLTDIAANAMASRVTNGATLADAFSTGMRSLLDLDFANAFMMQDTTVYLNVLKGSIKSDTMYYSGQSLQSRELLDGLDYLGVMLDLPTKDVVRVVGASAQSDYLLTGVDGSDSAINAGAWVGSTFDPAAPQALKALMNAKVPDGQKVTDAATGTKVAPRVSDYMSKYMVMDFIIDTACRSNASLYMTSRYPYYALHSQGGMQAADCTAAAARIAELKARIDTNKSSTMK